MAAGGDGEWSLCTSNSTGKQYWYHSTRRLSLWTDPGLPEGWAFRLVSKDGPKEYYHLETHRTTLERPTRKRGRDEVEDSKAAGAAAAPGPTTKPEPSLYAPSLPKITGSVPGFPEVRPAVAAFEDDSLFRKPHRQVVRDLLRKCPQAQCVFDFGAGLGASTDFLLQAVNSNTTVYAVDVWDGEFAAKVYSDHGLPDIASVYKSRDVYGTFCANFWDHPNKDRLVPFRTTTGEAIVQFSLLCLAPALIYVDAELHYYAARETLAKLCHKFPEAMICGGSWDIAPGLTRAVREVAKQFNKPLSVEDGQCWSFTPTGNASAATTIIADIIAETVHDDGFIPWIQAISDLIMKEDNPDKLAVLVDGRHQELHAEGERRLPFIDSSGTDKRRLNSLMLAAKYGRTQIVRMLVDRFGADVNIQAPASQYTAVLLAAWEGKLDILKFLLEKGANPLLENKFHENARIAAQKQKHADCLAVIEAHLAAAPLTAGATTAAVAAPAPAPAPSQ